MRNYCGYSNPEVDRLFAEGRRELDRSRRAEKYARIQEILYEDQPYTWLFWRNSFYGFSKSLRGYVFSPRGPYHYSPGSGSLWKPRAGVSHGHVPAPPAAPRDASRSWRSPASSTAWPATCRATR